MSTENIENTEVDLGSLIDDQVAAMGPAEKDLYLRMLFLLNQSERFTKFIDDNFDIHTSVNDEARSIDLAVIEKPDVKEVAFKTVGMELDVAKSLKAQMILKHNGCKNTAACLKSIVQILTGQSLDDKPKLVTSATDADISAEVQAKKAANSIKMA